MSTSKPRQSRPASTERLSPIEASALDNVRFRQSAISSAKPKPIFGFLPKDDGWTDCGCGWEGLEHSIRLGTGRFIQVFHAISRRAVKERHSLNWSLPKAEESAFQSRPRV